MQWLRLKHEIIILFKLSAYGGALRLGLNTTRTYQHISCLSLNHCIFVIITKKKYFNYRPGAGVTNAKKLLPKSF